jgi:hypothetical protein
MARDSGEDRQPFRLYVREPSNGRLICDGLVYLGERCVRREARKVTRVLGLETRVCPCPGRDH